MLRPMLIQCLVNLYLFSFVTQTDGNTLSDCELVMELIKQGFPKQQLSDWMCLIESESSKRTEVIGGPDADGSFDYGLFQINDRYWCSVGDKPGKGCNVTCNELLTDDITNSVQLRPENLPTTRIRRLARLEEGMQGQKTTRYSLPIFNFIARKQDLN